MRKLNYEGCGKLKYINVHHVRTPMLNDLTSNKLTLNVDHTLQVSCPYTYANEWKHKYHSYSYTHFIRQFTIHMLLTLI